MACIGVGAFIEFLAEFERDLISERTTVALAHKREPRHECAHSAS